MPFSVFPGGSEVKRLPAVQETWIRSLGQEDPLEKETATHSSTLAWKIPWTEEPGRLQSVGRQESDTTEQLHFLFFLSMAFSRVSFPPKEQTDFLCLLHWQVGSLPLAPPVKPKIVKGERKTSCLSFSSLRNEKTALHFFFLMVE